MIRNYRRGEHETLELDLSDVGSSQFMVRADGIEGNAFYDMAIYSDSGRTTPIPSSSWEYYTEDTRKTESEADEDAGGTGETVYSEIRITDPTYQSGDIYLEFESFGTYPDGTVQCVDRYEPGDNDYAFTTQRNLITYIVFDGLTADRTVTVTDGGFDERSRFKVVNNDSTYKVIVKDGTEDLPYWVYPGKSTEFYDVGDELTWSSAGWETVYDVPGNAGAVDEADLARGSGSVKTDDLYKVTSLATQYISADIYIHDVDTDCRSTAAVYVAASNYYWDESALQFTNDSATYRAIKKIQVYHNAA